MNQETFKTYKTHELYQYSAVPFINTLLLLEVPLSAIDTNDWNCNTMLRVYVTREYGRNNGGEKRMANVSQFGHLSAKRLSIFYHKN